MILPLLIASSCVLVAPVVEDCSINAPNQSLRCVRTDPKNPNDHDITLKEADLYIARSPSDFLIRENYRLQLEKDNIKLKADLAACQSR